MHVSRAARDALSRKYAGREFAVFDLEEQRTLGPWTPRIDKAYSARDAAMELTGDPLRFMVKHRAAGTGPASA